MEPRVSPMSESGGSVENERDREIGLVDAIALGAGTIIVPAPSPARTTRRSPSCPSSIRTTAATTGTRPRRRSRRLRLRPGSRRRTGATGGRRRGRAHPGGDREPRRDHRRSDAVEPGPIDRLRGDSGADRPRSPEHHPHDQAADRGDRTAGREGPAVGRRGLRLRRGRPVGSGPRRRLSSWSTN